MSNGKIIVTTTGTVITPYQKNQCYQLEVNTSTYDMVYHKRNPVTGFFLNYPSTKWCFVTHHHNTVWLENQLPGYVVEYVDSYRGSKLGRQFHLNSDITPREVQSNLIQEVISLEKKHQWFIYLSQGLGKTLLSIYLMSYFNVKTLIMCYNKDILSQWVTAMKEKTTVQLKRVLLIDESLMFKSILNGKLDPTNYDIFLCTPGLLTSFAKKYGFDLLQPLMEKMQIGFKIFDEAHRNVANIVKINAFTSIDKTLYLSGDYGQSNPTKEKLYYNMFHNIPILKPSEELMDTLKFTVAVVIQYNSKPSSVDKASVRTRRGLSFYNYMKYQFKKPIFFDVLNYTIKHIQKTNMNHYKILILVNMIDHVDLLYDELSTKYKDDYIIGKYHSEVPEEEKEFCREHCNMIISTYSSFSTGIDVSLIKYIISCSICSKIEDNQSSGRARPLPDNSDAYYFMLADVGIPDTKRKLHERLQYLKETKIKNIVSIKYIP